jgi:hypothetical protein
MVNTTVMPSTRLPYGIGHGLDGPVPIPRHLKIVVEILQRRSRGETLQSIATRLNRRGIPSPFGKKWQTSSITHILKHRDRYAPFLSRSSTGQKPGVTDWGRYGVGGEKKSSPSRG